MKRNTGSQIVGAQMVSATDGSAFTSAVTCYVTGDGGTQAAGSVASGACTHEGNGFHTYGPAQAETDYAHVAFTFTGTGAVPTTVQVYPSFPQTGDSFVRLGAPAGASVSADIATIDDFLDTEIAAILADTNELQTDWVNGGRLDLIVDAILADTGTDGVVVAAGSKTGYSLTATTGLGNQTADITGSLSGSVGSVTGAVGSVTGAVGSVTGAVGSVTGNVGGNVTGSVGSIAAGGIAAASFAAGAIDATAIANGAIDAATFAAGAIDAAAIADGAIDAAAIATGAIDADAIADDAINEIADGLLDRNMATGTDSGSPTVRTVRQALRAVRNKVAVAAGTATIYKEDDATASWTASVATSAGDPISSVDPAGP